MAAEDIMTRVPVAEDDLRGRNGLCVSLLSGNPVDLAADSADALGRIPQENALTEAHEIKVFYDRWKASVLRFCCLFLGRKDLGAECTGEAFLNYLREEPALQTSALPSHLMRLALAAVKRRSALVSQANLPGQSLRENLLRIPCEQRAVFIMRSVLGMSDSSVALATELPMERMRGLWRRSLFNLREMLPREFFERAVPDREGDLASVPMNF
jgi:hypothetical protein